MFNIKFPSISSKTILYVCVFVVIVITLTLLDLRRGSLITQPTDYYIDVIDNVTVTSKNIPVQVMMRGKKDLFISGWAVDERSKLPAGSVEVNIDGKLFPATYGLDRPDVAKSYDIPAYRFSGFQTMIPVADIGKGEHILSLKVFTNNNKDHYPAGDSIKFEIN